MWVLLLNDMRHSKVEFLTPVARAKNVEDLGVFVKTHKVDLYMDEEERGDGGTYQWAKEFRKGSPLEWYNPPRAWAHPYRNAGTLEGCIQQAGEQGRVWWERMVASVPLLENGQLLTAGKPDVSTFG